MKSKILDCPTCKRKTTWIRQSNQTTSETIFLSLLTFGVAAAVREFWWKCTVCDETISETD